MTSRAQGHDGPYPAPVETAPRRVEPDWIDYNGHMNVAYYTMAADQAIDRFLEDHLGLGEAFAVAERMGPYALQSSIRYLAEMLEGETFTTRIQLIDADAKRLHIFCEITKANGSIAATVEQMLMNVDLGARRAAPYPDWAQARIAQMKADHASLPSPIGLGAPIGIRRG